MKKHILTGFLCLSCLYLPSLALANDDDETIEVSDVYVFIEREEVGTYTFDMEKIMLPTVTKNVTEVLRGLSAIQFDSTSRNSSIGAEITPSQISINGARYFENNFTINGLNNNNYLSNNGNITNLGNSTVPNGYEQAMFIDTSLFSSIEVFSDNVSAKYGDFLGGVVNSTLRDAKMDTWHGSIKYQYSNDELTSFYWTDTQLATLETAETTPNSANTIHDKFTKSNFTAIVEGPIGENTGIIASHTRNYAVTPFYANSADDFKEYENTRLNENYMLRLNTLTLNDNLYLALTGIYAPYTATGYNAAIMDAAKTEFFGGGTTFMLNSEAFFDDVTWSNDISYSMTGYGREAESDAAVIVLTSTSGLAYTSMGGQGNRYAEQNAINWKSVLEFEPIGNTITQNILAGFEFKRLLVGYTYESKKLYSGSMGWVADTSATGSLDDGVLEGIGYVTSVNYFGDSQTNASYSTIALFAEDTINWNRFTLRPGVRFSSDTVVHNLDIAPRLFANVDILDNRKYNVFGGYNRYYGNQVLDKFIGGQQVNTGYKSASDFNVDNFVDFDWSLMDDLLSQNFWTTTMKDMVTPYTDELTIGASAKVLDTFVKLNYVHRDNKDQIREYTDTDKVIYYANNGASKYDGVTLSLDRTLELNKLGKHSMGLSATYSQNKGNFTSYTSIDNYDEGDSISPDFAYLDGEFISMSDMPATVFNSPLVVVYNHQAGFFDEDRLRLFAQFRWEMGSDRLLYNFEDGNYQDSSSDYAYKEVDGTMYYTYTIGKQGHLYNCDLAIEFDVLKHKNSVFSLEASVINAFNTQNLTLSNTSASKKIENDSADGATESYAMGRQFYLGGKFTF